MSRNTARTYALSLCYSVATGLSNMLVISYYNVSQNVSTLSRYNRDIHELILIIYLHECYWESQQLKGTLFSHLT